MADINSMLGRARQNATSAGSGGTAGMVNNAHQGAYTNMGLPPPNTDSGAFLGELGGGAYPQNQGYGAQAPPHGWNPGAYNPWQTGPGLQYGQGYGQPSYGGQQSPWQQNYYGPQSQGGAYPGGSPPPPPMPGGAPGGAPGGNPAFAGPPMGQGGEPDWNAFRDHLMATNPTPPEGWDSVLDEYKSDFEHRGGPPAPPPPPPPPPPGAGQAPQGPQPIQGQPGIDRLNPGTMEQFTDRTAEGLLGEGYTENWLNAQQGKLNMPRNIEGRNITNRAEEAYQNFSGSGLTSGLDPFYDNAERQVTEGVNQDLAARGLYGSSAGLDQLGEARTNLRAQQANREGDFRLQAHGLGGQLGRGADISSNAQALNQLNRSLAQNQSDLSWTGMGLGAAGQADQAVMNRLGTGANIANLGQAAREARLQNMFNNTFLPAQGLMDRSNAAYQGLISGDQGGFDAALAAEMGLGAEALAQGRYNKQDFWNDVDNTAGLAGSVAGMG